jgi:hypothetical protein
VERARVVVSQGRVRVEEAPGESAALRPSLLLHTVREEVSLLDHPARKYTVVSLATLRGMSSQFDNLLDLLPEAHRAGVEGLVRQPARALTVKRLGRTLEVGGKVCEGYLIASDGKPEYEVWMAPESDFLEQAPDIRTLRKTLHYLSEFSRSAPGSVGEEAALAALERVEGLPLRIRQIAVPGKVMEIRVETKRVDPALFRPPAGYERSAGLLPGM